MEDVLKTLNLSDDTGIFRGYATMIELYNALYFITMLFFIQKIFTFIPGVAFLKSVNINAERKKNTSIWKMQFTNQLTPTSPSFYVKTRRF